MAGHGAVANSLLLFVCHANICRSPMAERLTRHDLADRLGPDSAAITVASAGTHALEGEPMHPAAAQALRESGVEGNGFRSRPLTAEMVTGADLILAASRRERAACAELSPAAVGRTFTIRQFGRLADALGPLCLDEVPAALRWRTLVAELRVVRGRLQPVPAGEDDLADPVAGPVEDFRACAAEIQRSLSPALALIAPS
jgi:protein-tyrosine phosphatase